MKKKTYPFSADLTYKFRKDKVDACAHCGRVQEEHADNSCLFEASEFKVHDLKEFFDQLVRKGGEITLTSGPYRLTQKIKVPAWDQILDHWQVVLRTNGAVELEKK